MNTEVANLSVTFAGLKRQGTVPKWARRFDSTRSTVADLCWKHTLPDLCVVQSTRPQQIIDEREELVNLMDRLVNKSNLSSRIIFSFDDSGLHDLAKLAGFISTTPGLVNRVELAFRRAELEDVLREACVKVLASRQEKRADPLAQVQTIIKAGQDLRSEHGRLDAKNIANVFGITQAELARQIRCSPQRIAKTSDAEALQPLLRPYERIGRLRTILSDKEFKSWLNEPNKHLEDGDTPLGYLKAGAAEPLAAFAENMLTGAPA